MDYLWTGFEKVHKNQETGENLQNTKSPKTRIKSSFFDICKTPQKLRIRNTGTTDRSVGSSNLLWRAWKTL